MSADAGAHMKSCLRTDLRALMRLRRKAEAALVRELIAALDNAEATPRRTEQTSAVRHEFLRGSAEAERLRLSADEVRAVIAREIETREQAAAEFDRLGDAERADALRAEVLMARHYLEQVRS